MMPAGPTPTATSRSRQGAMVIALALLAAFVLGGCNNQKKDAPMTLEQLQQENKELRDRNAQVEQALNDAESKNAALTGENAQIKSLPHAGGGSGDDVSGVRRGGDRVISIAGDVLFGPGSATLKATAKPTLDKIAAEIKSKYGANKIEIAGYTDSDPLKKSKAKFTDNENLSAQRALAVERYFKSKGVNGDKMHSSAYGAADPKGSKKDSRRVEIVILGG